MPRKSLTDTTVGMFDSNAAGTNRGDRDPDILVIAEGSGRMDLRGGMVFLRGAGAGIGRPMRYRV